MEITDVGIIGASSAGRGLAAAMSLKGINVILVELNKETLERGLRLIEEELDQIILKWGLTESEKKAAMARISGMTDITKIDKRIQMVIVTVREELELNKEIFQQLDELLDPHTILVSHTAILSITEIANATNRPDKVAGIIMLPPVIRVEVAEVIGGLTTSQETFDTIKNFIQHKLGKTPIEVSESAGYITIRMLVNMLNEAMFIAMEGVASIEDIDTTMKLGYSMKRGPFQIADRIGLDLVLVWMEYMCQEIGQRPCPLLAKLVRAGHLGRKAGRGFYVYDENGKRIGPGALGQLKKWSFNI